ncbi:helix-turn-helix domain-containing protein [Methanosarcina sp. UBA289]|uniref:helix-turn-helix domain-containing protein n=1 Tax=Methanosarcina sp. UBA289 TaxID=1915574 RepID=UPI0025F2797C|nr:helix-turn-helix domain-containing protein [Methanosarcina sp. UBA289]
MSKPEQIPITRHLSYDKLVQMIKAEKNCRVVQRLIFIKARYEGKSVKEASNIVGISRSNGNLWQQRWNSQGYEGLIPKFRGGSPSKLSDFQKTQLKEMLKERDNWLAREVQDLILQEFSVEYSLKQVWVILQNLKNNK